MPGEVAVGRIPEIEPAVLTFFFLHHHVLVFVCNSFSQCSSDDDTVSSVSQQRASRGRRDSVVSCRVVSCEKVRLSSFVTCGKTFKFVCVRWSEHKGMLFVKCFRSEL